MRISGKSSFQSTKCSVIAHREFESDLHVVLASYQKRFEWTLSELSITVSDLMLMSSCFQANPKYWSDLMFGFSFSF
jgi:hypothetical protein